jgi:hypothetical protein
LFLALALLGLAAPGALASVAGAHSLQIPPGARSNGLGMSGVALAEDATAGWWNPAGLGFMRGKTLGFMHSQLVPDLADDIYYEFAGWVHQLPGWGTYSLSLIYLTYGQSPITTDSPEPQGYFNSYEFSPALSYGIQLDDNTALGMGLKYVRVDLAPVEAVPDFKREGAGSSVAVDLGVIRKLRLPVLGSTRLGAALTNFGPNISFIDEEQSDPMPRHFKAGLVSYLYEGDYGHVLISGDYSKMLVSGGPTILNGGAELQYGTWMALRMGYVHDPDGDITDLTFGGGFHVELGSRDFYLDYASIPQASDLDRVHRFSFEIFF